MVGARNARRDVVVDQVGHAELVHQAVARRQLDTGLPLFGRDAVLKTRKVGAVVHGFKVFKIAGHAARAQA